MSGPRLLVTGGSGFLGPHVVRALRRAEAGVVVRARSLRGLAEEQPAAYKNVDEANLFLREKEAVLSELIELKERIAERRKTLGEETTEIISDGLNVANLTQRLKDQADELEDRLRRASEGQQSSLELIRRVRNAPPTGRIELVDSVDHLTQLCHFIASENALPAEDAYKQLLSTVRSNENVKRLALALLWHREQHKAHSIGHDLTTRQLMIVRPASAGFVSQGVAMPHELVFAKHQTALPTRSQPTDFRVYMSLYQ